MEEGHLPTRLATPTGSLCPRLLCPTNLNHAASPILTKYISSCLEPWLPQMPMSTSLTRSQEDVDHTLGNASLQSQLCKLQGCEWGHLKRQERRLGQEGLGSGVLPSSSSILGSKQGEAVMAGRPSRGSPIIAGTANPASFPTAPVESWE